MNQPILPPRGYASWLEYAIATMDTRTPYLDSLNSTDYTVWTRTVAQEEMREAAMAELCGLREAGDLVTGLKTYMVARWGNEQDGPDGSDTNFLVAASSPEEAGRLADKMLRDCRWHLADNVQDFCGGMVLIGSSLGPDARLIGGPWVSSIILVGVDIWPTWRRLERDGAWERWEGDP